MAQQYVIIVAGGTGSRMNQLLPKQYLILEDKPVLMHTIQAFIRVIPSHILYLYFIRIWRAYG